MEPEMAKILVSRDLYDETPHDAQGAAHQQVRVWNQSSALGLTQDYYPSVDMEAADLYIGGDVNMLEELLEYIDGYIPYFSLSVSLIAQEGEDVSNFERFLDQNWLDFEEE